MTDPPANHDGGAARELDPPPSGRAKPLTRRLPLPAAPPDLVPARMINETLYCERLMYLEWSQGEFTDNVFTVDGRAVHARAQEEEALLRRRLQQSRALESVFHTITPWHLGSGGARKRANDTPCRTQ